MDSDIVPYATLPEQEVLIVNQMSTMSSCRSFYKISKTERLENFKQLQLRDSTSEMDIERRITSARFKTALLVQNVFSSISSWS